jgi:hypothetical protein
MGMNNYEGHEEMSMAVGIAVYFLHTIEEMRLHDEINRCAPVEQSNHCSLVLALPPRNPKRYENEIKHFFQKESPKPA